MQVDATLGLAAGLLPGSGLAPAVAQAANGCDDPQLAALVPAYWRYVLPEEVADRTGEALVAAVAAHRLLARQRQPGELLLRLTSPAAGEAGWASGRTVVEVVTDDMPFLVDSVTMELTRQGLGIHLVVHPQLRVARDGDGLLEQVPAGAGTAESWMHVEVDRLAEPAAVRALSDELRRVLGDVRDAVRDWPAMRRRALAIAEQLVADPPPVSPEDVDDARDLLRWLAAEHFTFLGYRERQVADGQARDVPGTGLGILSVDRPPAAPPVGPRLLGVTKADERSTVHAPGYLDRVAVLLLDRDGEVRGEQVFLGLFSSGASRQSVRDLPVVRRKVARVLAESGLPADSHSGRELLAVLETYPREELFEADVSDLLLSGTGVLRLAGRRRVRLFARRDPAGRFWSFVVYLPRERYTSATAARIRTVLVDAVDGVGVDLVVRVGESALARLHVTVRTAPGHVGDLDVAALERRVAEVTRSWDADLRTRLRSQVGEQGARLLLQGWAAAFPEPYRDVHDATEAVRDLLAVEALGPDDLSCRLHRVPGGLRMTVVRTRAPVALSDLLPLLQSLGLRVLDETPYVLARTDAPQAWLYDVGLAGSDSSGDLLARARLLQQAVIAMWAGRAHVDGLNALVLHAGLGWQQVAVLRTYAAYLRQAGAVWSDRGITTVLVRHPRVAAGLVQLFEARFDPAVKDREPFVRSRATAVRDALDQVLSLDADRVLRALLSMLLATVRTTAYQRDADGRPAPYVAVKLEPEHVPDLPQPRPAFEVFAISPRWQGLHLRFGFIARGGLRWSDRPDDVRTEVLGLVKAQRVKNSVIVPDGAKGAFVLAHPPADRAQLLEQGVSCYREFVSALLDVTDDLVDGQVVPADLVRHDGDDAYLVVAADKGTATLSDTANAIAQQRGYWLGDAFASGGSVGFDHKAMGITARGAWESVRRHLAELGVDVATDEISCVGIGDMSGDVFGNGMLLSPHLRLVAAFDHRHVFLDPDPEPGRAFSERRRLFALPGSSWADYDPALLSAGGGVWPRSAKSVPVSAEARAALGLPDHVVALTPPAMVHAILCAPVDLLWNGGVGTYVKAGFETPADVGDKSNDAVRVDGDELRCRVIGEGGNLGLTQRGRIQAALAGVRLNTDAIDNSAGVDTSDHEVNIKILLAAAIRGGRLAAADREPLLAAMTEEVASHVLAHNLAQNAALGEARATAVVDLALHARLVRSLAAAGRLDREVEALPTDEQLRARAAAGQGLTSPELSVLLAYVKIDLTNRVLASGLADEPWSTPALTAYFPQSVRHLREDLVAHPLRREIIATQLVNGCVDAAGLGFVQRAVEETGADPVDVLRAHAVVREVFGLAEVRRAAAGLDVARQTVVHAHLRSLLEAAVGRLLLRSPFVVDVEVERLSGGVRELLASSAAPPVEGLPEPLASRVGALADGAALLDVLELAASAGGLPVQVQQVRTALSDRLSAGWLLGALEALPHEDWWQARARATLREDVQAVLSALTERVLAAAGQDAQAWLDEAGPALTEAREVAAAAQAQGRADLPALQVAVAALRGALS